MEAVKDIDSQTVKMHCYSVSKSFYIWNPEEIGTERRL